MHVVVHTTGCTFDSSCNTSRAYHTDVSVQCVWKTVQTRAIVAYLLTKPLDVALSQLLATHEALDPAIQGGNCCWLRSRNGRQLHRLGHLDVLHIGIHGCGVVTGGGVVACGDGERSEGFLPSNSNLANDVPVCKRARDGRRAVDGVKESVHRGYRDASRCIRSGGRV
jgi:hypothetical protein